MGMLRMFWQFYKLFRLRIEQCRCWCVFSASMVKLQFCKAVKNVPSLRKQWRAASLVSPPRAAHIAMPKRDRGEVVDLTEGKRRVLLSANGSNQRVCRLDLPGGVLDKQILSSVAAIAQQLNCVGCDGLGLAEGVAKTLPYGCSYKERRRQPPGNKFAIPEDRATPGTIDVRVPPPGTRADSPVVLNLFAQWELGAAGKYCRVPLPPGLGPETPAQREAWFRSCLEAIERLGARKPASIAFPHDIGCGLAGGNWLHYEGMILAFAHANPDVEVTIVRWTGGGGKGGQSSSSFSRVHGGKGARRG